MMKSDKYYVRISPTYATDGIVDIVDRDSDKPGLRLSMFQAHVLASKLSEAANNARQMQPDERTDPAAE